MSTTATLEGTIDATAERIQQQLDSSLSNELENAVAEWCDEQGLQRLDDPYQIVARQAAFNELLKATLYEDYHQHGRVPALGSDVRETFRQAAEAEAVDEPAFHEYVLDDVAWLVGLSGLEDIIKARHKLASTGKPAEKIGQLYESLTPQESRRKLGQFRTPASIASLMAEWTIEDGTETVLDPGMGACALSAAAYQKKQEAVDEPPLSDIFGVDISNLALVMGACTLNLLDHGGPHELRTGDFLASASEDIGGVVDALIANPPYSRHHELTNEYKTRINSQAEDNLGRDVSALSPLYAYFYYHASQFLGPGSRVSYITPSEFLETEYGTSLKQYLVDVFDIEAFVLFDRAEDSVFTEAMTTSLVSFLEKSEKNSKNSLTRFIRVDEYPGEEVLSDAIADDIEGKTDWGFVNTVPQEDLEAEEKWSELFDPLDVDTSQLSPLSDLATVNRGIATGANPYFCLSQSTVDEWDIEEYVSPLIRNSRSVPHYDYLEEDWEQQRNDGDEAWLLYHLEDLGWDAESYEKQQGTADNTRLSNYESGTSSESSGDNPAIIGYLKHGMSDEIEANDSYLARNRYPWYVTDRRDPAPILVTYMSRGGCRFILNETDARNLNNLHGMYFDVDLEQRQKKALLAYLNSEFADDVVRQNGRTYSTGMDKIEPNELEEVPVLDPREVRDESAKRLAGLFDELRKTARDDGADTGTVIEEIDKILEHEMNHK